MKTVVFVRVSSEIQDNERQLMDIQKYCNSYNFKVVETFKEKESGTHKERIQLTAMKNYIQSNVVDYVVISELSRLGRTKEVLNTIDFLHLHKVGLISLKEGIKSLNPDKSLNSSSQLIIGILATLNEYELSTMKYRMKSGIRKSFADGKSIGVRSIAFGYLKDESGKLIINDKESEVVKRIFDLYTSGNGTVKIAKILNSEGVKPRRSDKWVDGVIYAILKNSIYVGKRRFTNNGEIDTLDFPALRLISNVQFEKVQELLKENAHKGTNNTYNYVIPSSKLVCGVCGQTYRAHRNAVGTDQRFICSSRRLGNDCGNYGIAIDKFESAINSVILNKMSIELFRNSNNSDYTDKINSIVNEVKELNDELLINQKKESKLVNMKLNDELSDETYNDLIKNIKNNKITYTKKITKLELEKNDMEESLINMNDINYYIRTGKKLDSVLINKMIEKVIINPEFIHTLTTRKDDKVLKCEIVTINDFQNVTFFISQRSNTIELSKLKLIGENKGEQVASGVKYKL